MFEPADEEYRTCGERGADCEPEPFDAGEGQGVRIALACPTHGVHSVVDLFEGKRQLVVLQQRRRPQRMRGGSTSKNGLEVARKRGKDGGRPRAIDDDKRTVILARRERASPSARSEQPLASPWGLCSAWYPGKRQGPPRHKGRGGPSHREHVQLRITVSDGWGSSYYSSDSEIACSSRSTLASSSPS